MISLVHHVLVILIFIILLHSCVTDFLYRQIKNICVIFILLLSVIMGVCYQQINIIIPALVLVVGFMLTLIGIMGAGDIKLIFALTIGMPSELVSGFFLATCCLGAPVAISALFISKLLPIKKYESVPFGIAISIGYFTVMWGI